MEEQKTANKKPSILRNSIAVIITLIAAIAIYATGYLIGKFQAEPTNGKIWNSTEVTIGITGSGGFMVYNHATARLEMYDETLGQFLFLSYANKIHKEETKK